jgi:hypothetical protein
MKLILGLPCLAATSINYLCTKSTCEIDNNIQTRELLETELEIIQSYAFSIIEDLLKQNIDQVGNLSLKKLRDELGTIHWRAIQNSYIAPQGRIAGFRYNVEDRSVDFQVDTLNELLIRIDGKRTLDMILLHECLGALGYKDEDYEISALLSALNLLNINEIQEVKTSLKPFVFDLYKNARSPNGPLRLHLDKNSQNILKKGGSTTGGGGGDPLMMRLKTLMIKLMLDQKEDLNALKFILNKTRLERPIIYTEAIQSGLDVVDKYPLSFERFLRSVRETKMEERSILLIRISDQSPLESIEKNLFIFFQQNYPEFFKRD